MAKKKKVKTTKVEEQETTQEQVESTDSEQVEEIEAEESEEILIEPLITPEIVESAIEEINKLIPEVTEVVETVPEKQELQNPVVEIVYKDEPKTMNKKLEKAINHVAQEFNPPESQKMFYLEEAAAMMLNNFQESWLPSLRVRCTLMGMAPHEMQTKEFWKMLFIAWGGSLILKK